VEGLSAKESRPDLETMLTCSRAERYATKWLLKKDLAEVCPNSTALRSSLVLTPANYEALRWRKRADETRTLANGIRDRKIKGRMLRIADDFDRLANQAEQQSRNDQPAV
jgi:hypothetical protein